MKQENNPTPEKTVKAYEKLQELSTKARVELEKLVKLVTKEADFGSKLVREKFDILNLNVKIDKKYRQLGKEVYDLVNKGEITAPTLVKIVEEINKLYKSVDKKKKEVDKLKKSMKKEVKKR